MNGKGIIDIKIKCRSCSDEAYFQQETYVFDVTLMGGSEKDYANITVEPSELPF